MKLKKKIIAIIPARKGSKRLKNKNIVKLGGKPLIAYTIEAALNCKKIDEVVVSTDCDEIKKISEKYGASVPFLRPKKISSDKSTSVDVVLHAIDFFENQNIEFENFILLQPTSPLRSISDIIKSIKLKESKKAKAVVSVSLCNQSPLLANELPKDLSMKNFLNKNLVSLRSQDLPNYYCLNGAIYLQDIAYFKRNKEIIPRKNCYAYIMKKENSIDIDNLNDLYHAEFLLKI